MTNKDQQLDRLTQAIERLIAIPPIPAIPAIPAILPIPPIPAIPPIVVSEDHNLLIKLDAKVDGLKDDIKLLSDGTTTTVNDHERRIRDGEKNITQIRTYGTALVFLIGIVEFLIIRFWK